MRSYEDLLSSMLARVPPDVDKRPGSIIHDAIAPAAAELAQMYIVLEHLNLVTFADESEGEYLTRRCSERGVFRKSATQACRKATFDVPVPVGSRFALHDTTYIVDKTSPEYILICEQAGSIGNQYSGVLKALTNIDGLKSAELIDVLVPGEDTEEDESLRSRYFDTINGEAFGGNITDYKIKVKDLKGVGGVKVYPAWNGGGTVKLVVIDSEYHKPSTTLISELQTAIDPVINQGTGVGLAPIGHTVTVESLVEEELTVSIQVLLKDGFVWNDVVGGITQHINEYLGELSKQWETANNLVVRASYIDTGILGVTGVLDVTSTLLNGSPTNVILGPNSIPKLKGVIKL